LPPYLYLQREKKHKKKEKKEKREADYGEEAKGGQEEV
jgi:hypothetical protein